MMSPGIILFLAIFHLYIDWFGLIKYLCGFTKKRENFPMDQVITEINKRFQNEVQKRTSV